MIGPSPQVNKAFEPPLAARPMPIRTGSLSHDPLPARTRARAVRLRQATSMLGMRSLQGFSQLKCLTLDKKARDRSGSDSGSSTGGRSVASPKGTRERPFFLDLPIVDGEISEAVLRSSSMMDPADKERPRTSLPAPRTRGSIIRGPFLNTKQVDQLRPLMLTPTTEAESPQEMRVEGVTPWKLSLDIDHDALREAMEEHPCPLSSNPTSEHDDDEPASPRITSSFVAGGTGEPDTMASYWPNRSTSSSQRRPRSITLAAAAAAHGLAGPTPLPLSLLSKHDSALNKQPCACDTIPQLHNQLANAIAGNSALLTLKAAHEETIAILRDKIRNQDETITRQESLVAELTWQVKAKETEQVSMIDNFCAEIASQNREIAQLGEDKWYLMGRVEELESKVATNDDSSGHVRQGSAKPREETADGSMSTAADDMVTVDLEDERRDAKSESRAASSHYSVHSLPASEPAVSIDNFDTPNTFLSSVFSPRPRSTVSNRSLYAATPTPSAGKAPSIQTSACIDSQNCLVTPPRRENKRSVLTNAFKTPDGSSAAKKAGQYSRDSHPAVAQVVLAATAKLEERLAKVQENLAASEARSQELEADLARQATLVQGLTSTSASPTSISSAQVPVPELSALTYTRSWTVWLDRVTSTFVYLGLLDFIQRDVPRPEISTWDATEVTDWTSRRLRAVVLLKHAVDDDILEDVLHLQRAKETTQVEQAFVQSTSAIDDPHQLFVSITSLRRIIATSATDLSWLDRIESADFDGLESFTSLVLCVDKRHGVMYGTSADHYDALLPKLQETMARLFPDLKGSMFAEDFESGSPRKWRQLPIWMAKVVKRRQISGNS